MTANAKVRLTVEGDRDVKQALSGIDRQVQKGNRARAASAATTARTEQTALNRTGRVVETNARKRDRLETDGHRKRIRHSQDESREAQRTAREQARTERTAQRRRSAVQVGGAIAGGVMNAGRHALSRVDALGGAMTARMTNEQIMAQGVTLREAVTRLAVRRGSDPMELNQRINNAAVSTATPQVELVAGLQQAQARFAPSFDFFSENLESLANTARASGAPLEVVIDALGKLKDAAPNMTNDQLLNAANTMIAMGNEGKVEFAEMSAAFGPVFGSLQRNSGLEGDPLVRSTGMLASMLASGGQADAQSATIIERMMTELNQPGVITAINEAQGLRGRAADYDRGALSPFHNNGRIDDGIDMEKLFEVLASEGMSTMAARLDVFKSEESRRGLGILQTALGDEQLMANLRGATSEQGSQFTHDMLAGLRDQNVTRAQLVPIKQMATYEGQGGLTGSFAEGVLSTTEVIAEYSTAHMAAIESLELFAELLKGIVGIGLGMKLLGLGGGAAGAAGIGGASVGALGASAALPVIIAGATGAGVGLFINDAFEEATGQSIGASIYEYDQMMAGRHVDQRTDVRGLSDRPADRVYAGGIKARTVIKVELTPASAAAIGNATAEARTTQGRREEGGAARR